MSSTTNLQLYALGHALYIQQNMESQLFSYAKIQKMPSQLNNVYKCLQTTSKQISGMFLPAAFEVGIACTLKRSKLCGSKVRYVPSNREDSQPRYALEWEAESYVAPHWEAVIILQNKKHWVYQCSGEPTQRRFPKMNT